MRCCTCQAEMTMIGCEIQETPKRKALPFLMYECAKCGKKEKRCLLITANMLIN